MMSTNKSYNKKYIDTKYGRVKVCKQFKYLGEIITPNGLDKQAYEQRKNNFEHFLYNIRYIYNKKQLSIKTKLRHYQTVIKPVILYGTETSCLKQMKKILAIERKILRIIYGPKFVNNEPRMRSNKEIYSGIETMEHTIRRKRM